MDKVHAKSKRLWLGYLVLGAVAVSQGGCLLVAAGAAGAGGAAVGYAYYQGKNCQSFSANFEDAWAATHTALVELGMPILNEERHMDNGVIKTQTSDGDRVRIGLDVISSRIPADGALTRICIRVGTFGDHPVSERILSQVGAHLIAVPAQNLQPERPALLPPAPLRAPNQTVEPPFVGGAAGSR